MNTSGKVNLFEQFDESAQSSEGLKHLERTKISLTTEQRSKNCIAVVTPSEHKAIRSLTRDLEDKYDERMTISDVSREFWLMMIGRDASNPAIREEILDQMSAFKK